jgi:ATP-dependent RNA helicase DDX19/DBP5
VDLRHCKVLVLDEADNMLNEGQMGDQSIQVKNAIIRANPSIQIVLFSATFPDIVRNYAQRFAPGANEIRLKQEELSLDAIKQFFMGSWSLKTAIVAGV